MKTPETAVLSPVLRHLVEDAGRLSQSLGIGRVAGQMYAYLYFSRTARNLADLQAALGISKGSASMVVRQLEQWGAVRKVWVRGDRKDYYEANEWLGRIVKNMVVDTVGKKLAASSSLLEAVEADLARVGSNGDEDMRFIRSRLEQVRRFQKRAQSVWNSPVLKMLLK